ncbi:MAG: hypothetical protein COA32_03050 [Fluviicola sp.]|nr:MAG: hypothetical protein COA32_03050 [Fluviicola sp.]
MKLQIGTILVLLLCSCSEHNAPEHLTAAKISQIELGMSKNEVIEILNEPISKEGETFQFTEKHDYNYPMLWVHFDSLGVRAVYAKYYDYWDDKGIYCLDEKSKKHGRYGASEDALKEYFN